MPRCKVLRYICMWGVGMTQKRKRTYTHNWKRYKIQKIRQESTCMRNSKKRNCKVFQQHISRLTWLDISAAIWRSFRRISSSTRNASMAASPTYIYVIINTHTYIKHQTNRRHRVSKSSLPFQVQNSRQFRWWTQNVCISMYIYTYIYIHVYVCKLYIYMYIWVHTQMCLCICIHVCVQNTHSLTGMDAYVCIYIYIHVCIYIYIHT